VNVAWFDGATAGDGQNNGAGGIICFNQSNVIKWTFNIGAGTNNRAELLGVWSLDHSLFSQNFQHT
jgi:ribonuclease HI